jgi:hypothetical protein
VRGYTGAAGREDPMQLGKEGNRLGKRSNMQATALLLTVLGMWVNRRNDIEPRYDLLALSGYSAFPRGVIEGGWTASELEGDGAP